jgi:pyruvate dehydrogenase E1 component beta subunit
MSAAASAARELYFVRGMYEGLRDAMREDPTVIVIGEDVDRSIIGATRGLIEEFGPERVRNTPISEATFCGMCVGAAAVGLRPVVDLMVGSFLYVAMDQVANQAAKLPYMSGGQVRLPITYFANSGPAGSAAAQHSENPHPMFMNVGGLKVVMPSTPRDARALMYASIRDDNPVVYFQDAVLAGTRGHVPENRDPTPLGRAEVKRTGDDVTVVAIGALVLRALAAAEILKGEHGVSVEVVDPRTLVPLDTETILASVRKTGRLVACDNAKMTCSAASEIVAMVSERAWTSLQAPPLRIAWENTPVPFSAVLEKRTLVDVDDIVTGVLHVTGGVCEVVA